MLHRENRTGSVAGYKDVLTDSEQAVMSLVARQPVCAAIRADQSSFQSYRPGVHGNNSLGDKFLLDYVVYGPVTGIACVTVHA